MRMWNKRLNGFIFGTRSPLSKSFSCLNGEITLIHHPFHISLLTLSYHHHHISISGSERRKLKHWPARARFEKSTKRERISSVYEIIGNDLSVDTAQQSNCDHIRKMSKNMWPPFHTLQQGGEMPDSIFSSSCLHISPCIRFDMHAAHTRHTIGAAHSLYGKISYCASSSRCRQMQWRRKRSNSCIGACSGEMMTMSVILLIVCTLCFQRKKISFHGLDQASGVLIRIIFRAFFFLVYFAHWTLLRLGFFGCRRNVANRWKLREYQPSDGIGNLEGSWSRSMANQALSINRTLQALQKCVRMASRPFFLRKKYVQLKRYRRSSRKRVRERETRRGIRERRRNYARRLQSSFWNLQHCFRLDSASSFIYLYNKKKLLSSISSTHSFFAWSCCFALFFPSSDFSHHILTAQEPTPKKQPIFIRR